MSHVETAERYAAQAVEEMNHGHHDTARTCAALATAFATLASATRGTPLKRSEKCAYEANHRYMDEPCPLCGTVGGGGR